VALAQGQLSHKVWTRIIVAGLALLVVTPLVIAGVTLVRRGAAREDACSDIKSLLSAHLLRPARTQYERLADAAGDSSCKPTASQLGKDQSTRDSAIQEAQGYRQAALRSAQREKLLVSAHAKHVAALKLDPQSKAARRDRAAERLRHATRVDATNDLLVQAHRNYLTALSRDPHSEGARRALRRVLRRERVSPQTPEPTCADAAKLVDHGVLPEARLLYERVLAADDATRCAKHGLARLAGKRATAMAKLHEGRLRDADDNHAAARTSYVEAILNDATATAAVSALLALDVPSGEWGSWTESAGRWVSHAGGDFDGVADGAMAGATTIALAVLVVLAAGLALWWWLFALRCRVRKRPPRVRLRDFTPADSPAAPGTAASFANELSAKPLHLEGATTESNATASDIDIRYPPPAGEVAKLDVQDLSAFPPAAGIAALVKFAVRLRPKDERVVVGQLLGAGDQGVGLQLQLLTPRGKGDDPWTMWANELKVGPLPDTEAYYALAVHAAEWARPKLSAPTKGSS
jgi:hypothetical protein